MLATSSVAMSESRQASSRMEARDCTENTPGPVICTTRAADLHLLARPSSKATLDVLHGAFLRVDVGTGTFGLHQQHGALAVAREPHIVLHRGMRLPFQLFQQMDQLAAGIVGQHALRHAAQRCAQQIEIAGQAVVQTLRGKTLRVSPRRSAGSGYATTDRNPSRSPVRSPLLTDTSSASPRKRAASCLLICASADAGAPSTADQDQARHHPVAQLLDHDLLRRGRRARQESRHIRIEGGTADDEHAG